MRRLRLKAKYFEGHHSDLVDHTKFFASVNTHFQLSSLFRTKKKRLFNLQWVFCNQLSL